MRKFLAFVSYISFITKDVFNNPVAFLKNHKMKGTLCGLFTFFELQKRNEKQVRSLQS